MSEAKESYAPAMGFRFLTPFYDLIVAVTMRERAVKQRLIHEAAIREGDAVLDLGCGTGTLGVWLKESCPGAQVVGLDGDPQMLAAARRKSVAANLPVRFDHALADALPYADGSFDRVVSSLFFHHLSSAGKEQALREVYRVLKPGSWLHIADWGAPANLLMRVLFFSVRLLDGFERTADNVRGRIPELLQQAGFEQVDERCTYATVCGTMALYAGRKPERQPGGDAAGECS